MTLASCIVIYVLPGLAGIAVSWNSFEMFGSKWLARIVLVIGWPFFLLVLPWRDR